MNTVFVGCICIGLISTLIFGRKYYSIFYVPIFKQFVTDAQDANKENPKTLTILFTDEPKTRFYQKRQNLNIPESYLFINTPTFTEKQLTRLLDDNFDKFDRVYLGSTSLMPATYRAIVLSKYPHIVWQRNYFSASTLLAAKGVPSDKTLADLSKNHDLFNGYDPNKWYDRSYHFNLDEEWGPGYSKPLSELVRKPSDLVDVIVKLKLSDLDQNPLLVLTAQAGDSVIQFKASDVKSSVLNRSDSTVTLIQSMKFIDLKYKHFDKPFLSTYIWNRDRKPLQILSFQVIYRKDNPIVYALNEVFEEY